MRLLLRDAWITALVIAFIALTIHGELNFKGIILGIGIALGYILAYTLNDYFDAEEDAMSKYKGEHNFFVNHKLSPILAITLLIGILGIMLIIFSSFGSRGIAIFILSITIMWAYSAGPLHLRNRPFFDVIIHAIFIISYPYFIILFLLDLEWLVLDYFLLSIFIVGSAIIQLENQIRDYDLDIINGNNTTITIGIRISNNLIKLLTIMLILIAIIGFFVIDSALIFLPFALIYSPIIYQRLVGQEDQVRTEKQIRMVIILSVSYGILLLLIYLLQ